MMSPSHTCVCILLAMVAVKSCGAAIFRIEAESAEDNRTKIDRSEASNKTDVLLHENDELSLRFCLNGRTSVRILNVGYSNDGGADKCQINNNTTKVGEFESIVEYGSGTLWNIFRLSGEIGSDIILETGCNTITLLVKSADDYGIEIDHIEVKVNDERLTEEVFRCNFVNCVE
ncbi:hypothetical protein SNE40_016310 [Patella caerulea]|uniref:Uncharacterized protein n=1 Tax=Patella caerulea TaxID=87958 RepID=A0AAN8JD16_PATCE